jgi:import receptor subunit TOM20
MKTSTAATVATLATGVLAYAIYFDYKRRNDTTFRKQLRETRPASLENTR